MVRYYPIALDITGWRCTVVGGGPVALQRVQRLVDAGARVAVVSTAFVEGFAALTTIERRVHAFEDHDLDDAFLAVAATNNEAVNGAVLEGCRSRGILVNIANSPEDCDFIVPALIERGALSISISTGGASPAFAARLRERLDDWLPDDVEAYLSFLEEARTRARAAIRDHAARSVLARYLASAEGYAHFRRLNEDTRAAWLKKLIDNPPGDEDSDGAAQG